MLQDLVVNIDLPEEQVVERDQIWCCQPVRGGVYSTSLQTPLYIEVRETWHVPPVPKPSLYRADYRCRAACCVQAVWPLKGHSGPGSSRSSGCSYPHSSPVIRADGMRNCWHYRWGKGGVVGQPKAKLAIQ